MASLLQYTPFIIWILCVGVSAILIGYLIKNHTEYSSTSKKEGFAVHICPSGSVSFITKDGETHCCNGDVVDGWCNGNLRCTLSPRSKSGLPTCTDLAAAGAAFSGISLCPPTMPNYFASTNLRGCSASQSTPDGKAPSDPNQAQCILYPTPALDQVKLDSCYNALQNEANKKLASSAACVAVTSASKAAASAAITVRQQKNAAAKAQVANQAAGAAAAAATKAAAEASAIASGSTCGSESSNPTGFVLYGEGISGNLAVTKILEHHQGPSYSLYFAQDTQYIRVVIAPSQRSGKPIVSEFAGYWPRTNTCDLSQFTSLETIVPKCGREASATYQIKQV